jgi:hypothetical protein
MWHEWGEKRNVYRLLVEKPEGKRPLGRPRRRRIDNIKMDLSEIGLNVVDWIDLAQTRYRWRALVNAVMNLVAAQLVASLSSGTQLSRSSSECGGCLQVEQMPPPPVAC